VSGLKRTTYYYNKTNAPLREQRDAYSLGLVRDFFNRSRKKDGIQMISMKMRRKNIVMNHKKIGRIKREYGLITEIRQKKSYINFELLKEDHKEVPNLLQRNFLTPLPDEVYSTDMTYLFYGNERAYVSATKDLGTNEIVSFNVMKKPTISEFSSEFERIFKGLSEEKLKRLIIHSDQGYQYTHKETRRVCEVAGVQQSMSRKGNCLDNAPIESFFGHFKDLLNLKDCRTFEDVEKEVEKTIHYYNNERPQMALNKKPPVEYRRLILSGLF
jgi:putative transposase